MRVFIAGIDGYLGWPLSQYLSSRGHEIGGCDSFLRRKFISEVGSHSITPIASIQDRLVTFKKRFGKEIEFYGIDVLHYSLVKNALEKFNPDVIVHLGEIPSAPYSMIDVKHATFTQQNNVIGTLNILFAMRDVCKNSHLIKLGTMGELGLPNIDITEGDIEIELRGRKDIFPFPKIAGSFYHWSKVFDSGNIMFTCKIWGLRSTDIMQGVVYGTRIPEMGNDENLLTRYDIDECGGTAINRFCASAVVGMPITLFGAGKQKRGFLPLKDSMQCLTLAIENPPEKGEYRVFNQFEEVYSLTELAQKVQFVGSEFGLDANISYIENPRIEKEEHYYNPDHQKLLDLGYKPTRDMESELRIMFKDLIKYKQRIDYVKEKLIPDIRWDGTKRKSELL